MATTPLSELSEAFLLLNVDRYRTGTKQTDLGTFPDVLTGLNEVEFVVKRFPQSVKEKLLLVVISRFIEHRALTNDSGELPNSAKESRRSRGDERGVSPLVGRRLHPRRRKRTRRARRTRSRKKRLAEPLDVRRRPKRTGPSVRSTELLSARLSVVRFQRVDRRLEVLASDDDLVGATDRLFGTDVGHQLPNRPHRGVPDDGF